jgi:hypothetical protein
LRFFNGLLVDTPPFHPRKSCVEFCSGNGHAALERDNLGHRASGSYAFLDAARIKKGQSKMKPAITSTPILCDAKPLAGTRPFLECFNFRYGAFRINISLHYGRTMETSRSRGQCH